jgi:hypothetical protein
MAAGGGGLGVRLSPDAAEFVPSGSGAVLFPLTADALLGIRAQVLSASARQAALAGLVRSHGEDAFFLVVRGWQGGARGVGSA